jgi:hypothetical protein
MQRDDILKHLMERELFDKDEYVILADGFEEAVMGVTIEKPTRVVYDYWKCLDIIIKQDEDSGFDEAIDWLDEFIDEKLGDHSPLYIKTL